MVGLKGQPGIIEANKGKIFSSENISQSGEIITDDLFILWP
jgi:hypothetical protein